MLVCFSQELVLFGPLTLWPLRSWGLAENSVDKLVGGPLPAPTELLPQAGTACPGREQGQDTALLPREPQLPWTEPL